MFFLCSLIFVCITLLSGCGSDPILDKAAELQKENSSPKTVLDQKSGSQKPGIPNEPKPVQVDPKPVQPKEPVQIQKEEKAKVVLSGNVEIVGVWAQGHD